MAARKLKKINVKRPEKVRVSDMKFATPFLLGKKTLPGSFINKQNCFYKIFRICEIYRNSRVHVQSQQLTLITLAPVCIIYDTNNAGLGVRSFAHLTQIK